MSELVHAVEAGKLEEVRKILYNNPNSINERDDKDDTTALHWAAKFTGQLGYPEEIIELILNAKPNFNIRDNYGHTPLYYAAENCVLSAVIKLALSSHQHAIKEAFRIAEQLRYASNPDSRKEVYDFLSGKIPATPSRVYKVDMKKYREDVLIVDRLYDQHIKPLYGKILTVNELQDSIELLKKSDTANAINIFRHQYKRDRDFIKPLHDNHYELDRAIEKFDTEVMPTYYLIKHLNAKDEINTIQFSSTQENDKGYDVLLSLDSYPNIHLEIHLELTRAVNGQQEHCARQLLKQDGYIFGNTAITYVKDKLSNRYRPDVPIAKIDLHIHLYPPMLLDAFKRKKEKQDSKKTFGSNTYDWLLITINVESPWNEDLHDTLQLFYSGIKDDSAFKRIFILTEPTYKRGIWMNCLWDSWNADNIREFLL